jgi:hypothetical protein
MKQRLLLAFVFIIAFSGIVNAQTRLVEKVTKQGSELVIPYEKISFVQRSHPYRSRRS